jgi:hypothetical protein
MVLLPDGQIKAKNKKIKFQNKRFVLQRVVRRISSSMGMEYLASIDKYRWNKVKAAVC